MGRDTISPIESQVFNIFIPNYTQKQINKQSQARNKDAERYRATKDMVKWNIKLIKLGLTKRRTADHFNKFGGLRRDITDKFKLMWEKLL